MMELQFTRKAPHCAALRRIAASRADNASHHLIVNNVVGRWI